MRVVRRIVVGVVVAAVGLVAAEARATCMSMARFRTALPDCTVVQVEQNGAPIEVWPAGEQIAVNVELGACCSPPGGPVSCSYEPAAAGAEAGLSLYGSDGSTVTKVEGTFRSKRLACLGKPVMVFDRAVPAGNYTIQAEQGGGIGIVVVDDERAAQGKRVSVLPGAEVQQQGAGQQEPAEEAVAPTRSPAGCSIESSGSAGLVGLMMFAVGWRRRR